jgi:hypothetical protein
VNFKSMGIRELGELGDVVDQLDLADTVVDWLDLIRPAAYDF